LVNVLKRDLFGDLTEKLKGLIKLPHGVVIWLIILQNKIWDRWEKREGLLKFCNWGDRLTKKKLDITPKVFLSIPNLLCVARLTIVPFYLLWLAVGASEWFYLVTYLILMALDVFDGPIARQTNTTSSLGKAIDPLGDKVCHLGMALAAVLFGFAPWWLVVNLFIKEGLLMSKSSHYLKSGSKIYGKVGTGVEVVVLSLSFIFTLSWVFFAALVILHWAIFFAYILTDE
jgi:cardiolipin synthase (CMP-forming)